MPTFGPNLDWLFWVLGGLIALGSVWVLIWAVFRDRARKRAPFRCPRCWYDLSVGADKSAPPLPVMCSECGRTTTKPRQLRKRRRRYRFALAALLMFPAAGAVAYYPSAHRNGWLSIVPSWMLIDSVPVFGYPTALTDELWRRNGCAQNPRWAPWSGLSLTPTDHQYLVHRVATGTWFAPPLSDRWKRTFGELQEDFRHKLFNFGSEGDCLQRPVSPPDPAVCTEIEALLKLPIEVTLRTRPVWPEGVPVYVEKRSQTWWPYEHDATVSIRDDEGHEWRQGYGAPPIVIECPAGASKGSLRFDVQTNWSAWRRAWQGSKSFSVSVPYRIEGMIEDIMTPVIDPAIDSLVAQIHNGRSLNLSCSVWPTCVSRTKGIAFGVIMEYMKDGVVQAAERVWWKGGTPPGIGRSEWGQREWVVEWPDSSRPYESDYGENWTLRIRSDPETALRVIDVNRYWQGDVTVQLTLPTP